MVGGQTSKPAGIHFWMVGMRSLIHWQSTDMQRLRRVTKSEVLGSVRLDYPSIPKWVVWGGNAMMAGKTKNGMQSR